MSPRGLTELVVSGPPASSVGADKMAERSRCLLSGRSPHGASLGMRRPLEPRVEKNLGTFPGIEGDKGLWTWKDRVQYTELQAVPKVAADVSVLFEKTVRPNFKYNLPPKKTKTIHGRFEVQKI